MAKPADVQQVDRPVLRYHGGKWLLAPWIISHLPQHRIYVEPYGGAASVLMRKPRSYAEVYNDKWDTVVNVFKVLRDNEKASRLISALTLTPFARVEFENSGNQDIVNIADDVERARLTILRSLAGFGSASVNGKHATGFRANANRCGTTPAHDFANYPSHIASFVSRLRGVVIENRDALQVMQQHDTESTLHYVDPPYVHNTRKINGKKHLYEHEMTNSDHAALADCLHSLRGMVVLSGYSSSLYDSLYKSWHRVERPALADGAQPRTEVLWLNDAAIEKNGGQLTMLEAAANG